MPLFQQSVVKKYLNDLDKDNLQQRWTAFTAHFHNAAIQQNILNAKEEEYQEGFVRDLFVNVLGYTLNPQPDYNFVLEKKTEADSTKSDGAILQGGKVVGVIELKDTATTDLDKVEKQAFGYKHRHRDCIYVITANFQKLRFYINDAIEYEEFDLFNLTQERFALLYLCLSEQTIFKNIPLLIKKASLTQEETVTKKLYADYSGFRKKLFHNIIELNPQYPKIELFQKTQKLLDRFLFILFAEDRLLVPPNSVREILRQWQQLKEMDAEVPLYERFSKYFGYLNTGHQGKQYEIFAYNGGLFATDEMLDHIKIDDALLYDSCMALSNYDFQTEIDVNILGHIFEHSLNEIEELERSLASPSGGGREGATRRKKDGIFYTPRYITKYIVANTVGALCEQKKEELSINEEVFAYRKRKDKKREELVKLLDDYRHWLLQLTICDPACGSGAFLNQALEYLIAEHRHIDELKANLFGDAFVLTDLDNEILEHNLFGVDINEEAVEIARLSLWLRTAKKDRKLSSLNNHIQCGNSLIDDPAIAGDKAFNWQKAFPKIFEKGGFDVVIGNPPYVRADSPGNTLDFREHLTSNGNFKTLSGKWDLYIPFVELSLQLLKQDGRSALIIPDAYCHANYSQQSLQWLISNKYLFQIDYFPEIEVFENVGVKSIIINNIKATSKDYSQRIFISPTEYQETILNQYPESFRLDFKKSIIENKEGEFLDLYSICYVSKGIVGNSDEKHFQGEFEVADLLSDVKDETHQKLYFEGKDIGKWYLMNKRWIEYGTERSPSKWSRKGFTNFFESSPKLVAMRSPGNIPRILLDKEDGYFNESAIGFKRWTDLKGVENLSLKNAVNSEEERKGFERISESYDYNFLLCILNSKLICFELNSNRRSNIHIYPEDYKTIPIPKTDSESQLPLIAKADIMLATNKELQELRQQLLQLLQSNFPGVQINKKLEQWPLLSFAALLKELSKQKIKPTLPQQSEWMNYFEEQKTKALALQTVIDDTDKEIDAMVYALYGLTNEEIKIVEGG
ncbi:MAG: restriction endonuclease subunit M [Chitinophagaceae bacterium]|nr:MAG: restriction endonuclease subunit M [Chitinophagaceae bacterium]